MLEDGVTRPDQVLAQADAGGLPSRQLAWKSYYVLLDQIIADSVALWWPTATAGTSHASRESYS